MITLRPIATTDASAVADAVAQSRDALRRWMVWYHEGYDARDAVAWIDASLAAAAAGDGAQFAVLSDTRSLIGVIGLEGMSEGTGRAMLGYWLATPAAGRGIGRQAIALALDWARAQPHILVVWAVAADANLPSRRVLEANHFHFVGSGGVDERGDLALLYELELRP
ncbi:MAG TPA: GNAT family N-acetyltransferase [Gemmatimonadaceae bacterium]|nr:GNAT family N-acetyltransferase [Gemmatimonadaceae bacterium]